MLSWLLVNLESHIHIFAEILPQCFHDLGAYIFFSHLFAQILSCGGFDFIF